MTEVDKVFQVAARRIQGLTAKVNHWKQRANELEAALGTEKAARIEAEVTRDRALNAGAAMRNEIARLRADLRDMSDRSDGSEWEKKAAEIEELRAELNSVKQELDCAKSEWDRAEGRCKALGGEVAEMFSDRQRLKAELAVIKDERNELRAKLEAIEAESRGCYEELSKIRRNALSCEPSAPTLRSHPVKVGEWVKNDNGDVRQVREVYAEYLLTTGWRWAFEHCTPCDPPESTEQMMLRREREFAVKEAADNAVEESENDTAQGDDIKVGDYVEVFQDTGYWTRRSDIGVAGKVSFTNGEYCHIPQGDGYYKVNLCDVRKIQREPKPGDVVRLVREPTHTDIPAMLPWSKAFGMPGDTATVVIMAVPDKIPNGTIPVRTSMGRAFFWPLSCIEIVDAK